MVAAAAAELVASACVVARFEVVALSAVVVAAVLRRSASAIGCNVVMP